MFSACVQQYLLRLFTTYIIHIYSRSDIVFFLLIQAEPIALFRRWMDDIQSFTGIQPACLLVVGKGGLRPTRSAGNAGCKRSRWVLMPMRSDRHMAFVSIRVAVPWNTERRKHDETPRRILKPFTCSSFHDYLQVCTTRSLAYCSILQLLFAEQVSETVCTLIFHCISWVLATCI